jgi:hypothetical protein
MGTVMGEDVRSERVSAAVDELLRDPEASVARDLDGADEALLGTMRRLARLPELLLPASVPLEQRVLRVQALAAGRQRQLELKRTARRLVVPWAVAGLATVLLIVALFTPFGETARAGFRSVFRLGRTEVRVTPADTASAPQATAQVQGAAISQTLTLAQAERQLPFDLVQPARLPPGFVLDSVTGYTYPDLPAWVPQPFSVELVYRDGLGATLALRQYPITLGEKDRLNTSALNLRAAPIQDVRQVDVGGKPGVLLSLGNESGQTAWQEVVWEQGNLILSLSATGVSEVELMRVARSVR